MLDPTLDGLRWIFVLFAMEEIMIATFPLSIFVLPHAVDLRAPSIHVLKEFRNANKIMVPQLERNTPPRRSRHS
jgi:hypothetical protein